MIKRIVLCADDYGQNRGISTGILALAERGRLSAISCMSTARGWPEAAAQLRDSSAGVDAGLHFTLTDEQHSLATVIASAYLRRLDKATVMQALTTQLDLFSEHLGREPDFVDGHQHIHQLPVVRAALLEVYQKRFTQQRPYVRSLARITASGHAGIKPQIIKALGGRPLQRALRERQIPHNHDFGGIYDFSDREEYRALMRYWLNHAQDGALFMCHPGLADSDDSDPIAAARQREFHYLNSDEFLDDCHSANVELVRGRAAGW
jgi:predicted glycoside hydrolase/deacetylase ChbG (UPF0249 family)